MNDGIRKVILNASEQRALAWLLSETANGEKVTAALPTVMRLRGIAKRLGRSTHEHLLKQIKRDVTAAPAANPPSDP